MKAVGTDKDGYKFIVEPPEGITVTKEALLKQASKLVKDRYEFKIVN